MNIIENVKNCDFSTLVSGKQVFKIPLFQRNYSWSTENCSLLFNDIKKAFDNKESYYIGNFIYYAENTANVGITEFILIDGQQRITTLLLLLCALRDVCNSNLKIDEEFIKNDDKNNKYKFKLKQNYNDIDDFEEIMDRKIDENKKSNIYNSYNTFVNIFKYLQEENFKFSKFYEFIKLNLETVAIKLNNYDIRKVQNVFEKLNSTGVELSPADLIRNYLLFSDNIKEQESLHKKWKIVEDIVEEKNISKFAKAYIIRYKFEDIQNDKVYFRFKDAFDEKEHKVILDDMIKYSKYFAIIENSKFYKFSELAGELNYSLCTNEEITDSQNKLSTTFKLLNILGSDDLNPLFFQLFDELYENDIKKLNDICELILEFMIRYRIVSPSTGGGALSSKIKNIMKKIDKKDINLTLTAIHKELSNNKDSDASKYPDDEEFRMALTKNLIVKNARVVLYQFARRKGYEIKEFDNNITVEHLMPQTIKANTPEGAWWIENLGGKDKWEKVYNTYLDTIGNFALLTRKLNSSISNDKWDKKRIELKERAADKLTQDVSKLKKFNESQLKNRNKDLANTLSQTITGVYFDRKGKNWLK